MEWLNIHVSFLDSPEFIGSDPISRATWLCLFRYCAGQENGGRISSCREWGDRKWQQLVRVTKQEIESDCDLWTFENDDLVVKAYPTEKEALVLARREAGRIGGQAKTQAKVDASKLNGSKTQATTQANTEATPKQNPSNNPTEGEGKGKGKEGEGEEIQAVKPTPTKFVPPTLDEAKAYCLERKNGIDAEHFIASYAKTGWKDKNGNPVKCWKSCIVTWEKNQKKFGSSSQPLLESQKLQQYLPATQEQLAAAKAKGW